MWLTGRGVGNILVPYNAHEMRKSLSSKQFQQCHNQKCLK